jgi:hypothetical protein
MINGGVTPARSAIYRVLAPSNATSENTARAASRIRWRVASADGLVPLSGQDRVSVIDQLH